MSPQDPGAPSGPLAPQPPRANPFEPPPVGSYTGSRGAMTYAPPTSSEAIGALVCGLLGWGCFPLGLLAIWLGFRARRAIRESGGQMGGEQLALAGMILGGITAGLSLLFFVLYFGFAVFAVAFHGFK